MPEVAPPAWFSDGSSPRALQPVSDPPWGLGGAPRVTPGPPQSSRVIPRVEVTRLANSNLILGTGGLQGSGLDTHPPASAGPQPSRGGEFPVGCGGGCCWGPSPGAGAPGPPGPQGYLPNAGPSQGAYGESRLEEAPPGRLSEPGQRPHTDRGMRLPLLFCLAALGEPPGTCWEGPSLRWVRGAQRRWDRGYGHPGSTGRRGKDMGLSLRPARHGMRGPVAASPARYSHIHKAG